MAQGFDDPGTQQLQQDFLGHLWPPFTQMQGLKPVIMERAEGAVVYDTEGNEYIDAFASLWTVNVGHGRTEIYDAVKAQMEKLAIYHIFQIANEPSIKLAAKVAALMPGDLNHVFLTLGGGESVETAVKMARQYHRNRGNGTKYMVLFRDRSYHGTTMTSTSAQGLSVNRAKFEPLLPGFIKLGAPYCYRCAWHKTYGEDCKMECAKVVEEEIAFYGPENVGTMLGETMIGTGGVIPPVPEYWPMVNEICKANDVLVINDEVITGFGRSGTWFGFQQFGSEPDLVTFAKGLSSGYLPLGAVGARDHVFEAFLGGGDKTFMSGATYNGHPLCSAAGLANLEIVEREKLVERCAEVGAYFQAGLKTLLAHPIVGDVRGVGLVAGIEYVKDKETREWFPPAVGAAMKVRDEAFKRGVFVRLLGGGHCHAIAPPFIISKEQIDTVVRVLDESIGVVENELGY
ncbi:MAG: aspartate aminotransferase family protein [Thermoleophilia bacterium]|jgi:adenosylmethionine-8-amino-7-oxononanoate aminotransferase|nr:aspartate aminotransferase family protein [Thermoleophilia bacterium]